MPETPQPSLALSRLLAQLSYKEGTFTLASGKKSDFYVDVKQTLFRAEGAALIGHLLLDRLRAHGITAVGGMAVGAVPLVAAALVEASRAGYPLSGFFVRKDVKGHGTAKKIDGPFDKTAKIAMVEDVVTTGGSTIDAIEEVEGAGGKVSLVLAVVDREENGGLGKLAKRVGIAEALTTKTSILEVVGS